MTHTEALNFILAHACPSNEFAEHSLFIVSVHCVDFEVIAKPNGDLTYEVISITPVDYSDSV